ncbi:MAG: RtcB family protein [Candidatus Omnitrophica bacterium]|nr:RtcB family protein [Candidatus Omnitrophota bacterium]
MNNLVRTVVHKNNKIPEGIMSALSRMAQVSGVKNPIVALPDLHFKGSYHTPTGVVVLTKNTIVPKFVNPNCGMTFIVTPFFEKDFNNEKIDLIFSYLRKHISVSAWSDPVICVEDLKDIVKNGASWAISRQGLDKNDLNNFENKGSLFLDEEISSEEILSFIPDPCQKAGLRSMGVLGFGNHFIEMQKAEEILHNDIAEKFGIKKGQICFMMHGDSREFGRSIFDFYSKKAKKFFGLQQVYKKIHFSLLASKYIPVWSKKALRGINYHGNRLKSLLYWKFPFLNKIEAAEFSFILADSLEGRAYRISTYAALNYAYANRTYMAGIIRDALRNAFDRSDAQIKILFDGSHDSLQQELVDGVKYWVHRNGASRAYPPKSYPDHGIFSKTGQPVLLPSCLGNFSFLCAANIGCAQTYYSSSHGTGRLVDRGEARYTFKDEDVLREVASSGMKVYDYGKGCVSEESPRAFKNVNDVLEAIEENNIAASVVKLKPVAVLKGWI